MKHLIQISTMIVISTVLFACGGGNTSVTSTPSTPAPVVTINNDTTPLNNESSEKLIIDNGRGVSNNQDTERAE